MRHGFLIAFGAVAAGTNRQVLGTHDCRWTGASSSSVGLGSEDLKMPLCPPVKS